MNSINVNLLCDNIALLRCSPILEYWSREHCFPSAPFLSSVSRSPPIRLHPDQNLAAADQKPLSAGHMRGRLVC